MVEQDLCEALENGEIAAAGLDVLCEEPMSETNPLVKIKTAGSLSLLRILHGQVWKREPD